MLIVLLQLLIMVGGILGAMLVLQLPMLQNYSLQFLAASIVIFILLARYQRRHKKAVVSPTTEATDKTQLLPVIQTALIGFGLLLLLGSTGGFGSWLLPLYFIYFLFVTFVTSIPVSIICLLLSLAFFYFMTPNFSSIHYGYLLSMIVYAPIAIYTQKFYSLLLQERQDLQLEREKVAYYNLYAEKQQANILEQSPKVKYKANQSLSDFVSDLIPQIDELQKMSRFPQNQLVVSAGLTKIGLSLRRALQTTKVKTK